MSLKVSSIAKTPSGPRYLPKAGTVPARILSVVDLGVQERKPFQGKPKDPARQVSVTFELPNDKFEYNGEMVPARISPKIFNVSMDPKSALFKFMQSVDPSNSKDGDLEQYPNTPCLVTIVHNTVKVDGQDRTYANVTGVMPAPDGFPVPELSSEPFVFSFDAPTLEAYSLCPRYLRELISSAVNFEGSAAEEIASQYVEPEQKEETPEPAPAAKKATANKGKSPY